MLNLSNLNSKALAVFISVATAVSCSKSSSPASIDPQPDPEPDKVESVVFTKQSGTFAGVALPYQQALINSSKSGSYALVLYLHGGSVRGNDNEKQMTEPGISVIANYLLSSQTKAMVVVPQCPSSGFWDASAMQNALRQLISSFSNINTSKIYILGGSMGGTGTWMMLSSYPNLFAAGMPCAGNPSKCNAENVAKTPGYAVMGTADNIMSTETVQNFIAELNALGGKTKLDVVTGWTHEQTCKQSYTAARLQWLFSQSR